MHIRVIGVGSRRGDDAAGLAVVRRLARSPLPDGVSVVSRERPGLDLLDDLVGADAVVLIDSMRSGATAGTVCRIPLEALRTSRGFSNHALGVAEALELAAALGRVPPRVEIVGIEGGDTQDGELSPAVARAVETAVTQVQSLLVEFETESAPSVAHA